MSLGNDYLNLIDMLWDVERFDMWNPQAHWSLAYLLDRLSHSDGYVSVYNRWISMIKSGRYNDFAWDVINTTIEVSQIDTSVSGKDCIFYESEKQNYLEKDYENNQLAVFGMVARNYAPEWYYGLFQRYMTLKETDRKDAVINYCRTELNMNDKRAEASFEKLFRWKDILNEFYFYIKNKRFMQFQPITVSNYSAQQLCESTYLSPLGAYNYLIYLRESPKEALEDLRNGLPRK